MFMSGLPRKLANVEKFLYRYAAAGNGIVRRIESAAVVINRQFVESVGYNGHILVSLPEQTHTNPMNTFG